MGNTKTRMVLTGRVFLLATAFLSSMAVVDFARADMASNTVLANTCFSCHGTDGDSAGAMPTIKGKSSEFISSQLMQFRDGKRKGTVMNRIAKGFTEDEINTLARYFAGQQ